MKEPTRLMHDGSPRAKELLASLNEDVPPDPSGGQERLLRALDLAPNSAVAPRERRQGPRRAWLALVAVGGLLVVSASAFGVSSRDGSMTTANAPAPHEPAPQQETVTSPTVEARAETPSVPTLETPSAPTAEATVALAQSVDVHALAPAAPDDRGRLRAAPRSITRKDIREAAPARAPQPAAAADGVDELALLEHAQRAASQGHPDEALSLVERHRREFPRGRFGVEMSVVEIEALARTGRIEDAASRSERFLERHPGSPYTRRVEAVVRGKNQKEETR
jgi:hypothetical protein